MKLSTLAARTKAPEWPQASSLAPASSKRFRRPSLASTVRLCTVVFSIAFDLGRVLFFQFVNSLVVVWRMELVTSSPFELETIGG